MSGFFVGQGESLKAHFVFDEKIQRRTAEKPPKDRRLGLVSTLSSYKEIKSIIMTKAEELIRSGYKLGIHVEILHEQVAQGYITKVLEIFKPYKTTGHLAIGDNAITISLEEHEFSYSKFLNHEPGLIFFEQNGSLGSKTILKIDDVRKVGLLFENSFGMEYFLTNENSDYLIAVNWYSIEVAGTAINVLN